MEVLELARGRRDEHRRREEGVVGHRGDDTHRDAVLRIGAGERIDDVEAVEPAEVVGDLGAQALVVLDRELAVAA